MKSAMAGGSATILRLILKLPAAKNLRPAGCAAQRVRVGVTGLSAVFLLVVLAAAGMGPKRAASVRRIPAETLSVLGVAPGAKPITPGGNS